jgi:hypothetical protein
VRLLLTVNAKGEVRPLEVTFAPTDAQRTPPPEVTSQVQRRPIEPILEEVRRRLHEEPHTLSEPPTLAPWGVNPATVSKRGRRGLKSPSLVEMRELAELAKRRLEIGQVSHAPVRDLAAELKRDVRRVRRDLDRARRYGLLDRDRLTERARALLQDAQGGGEDVTAQARAWPPARTTGSLAALKRSRK